MVCMCCVRARACLCVCVCIEGSAKNKVGERERRKRAMCFCVLAFLCTCPRFGACVDSHMFVFVSVCVHHHFPTPTHCGSIRIPEPRRDSVTNRIPES